MLLEHDNASFAIQGSSSGAQKAMDRTDLYARTAFVDAPAPPSSSGGRAISDAALARANAELATASPQQILEWAIDNLPNLYQTTAFGLTGLAALDMISKISSKRARSNQPPRHLVDLIFIDTLYHFAETLDLARRAARKYGASLHTFQPPEVSTAAEFEARYGAELWKTDEETYDYLVKVEPSRRAYDELGAQAVITGRRRSQGGDRAAIPALERDETGLIKVNPLAAWTFADTKAYIDANQVPYNALLDQGYKSVGDWHSTQPADSSVAGDAGERAGRWAGRADKSECGLHKDYFKQQAAFKKREREREQAARDAARDGKTL